MIEENSKKRDNISDYELEKVAGGKKVIERYKFYDVESKTLKAVVEIENGKVIKKPDNLGNLLSARHKDQLSADLRAKLGI